jgi:hypothetical protein
VLVAVFVASNRMATHVGGLARLLSFSFSLFLSFSLSFFLHHIHTYTDSHSHILTRAHTIIYKNADEGKSDERFGTAYEHSLFLRPLSAPLLVFFLLFSSV